MSKLYRIYRAEGAGRRAARKRITEALVIAGFYAGIERASFILEAPDGSKKLITRYGQVKPA